MQLEGKIFFESRSKPFKTNGKEQCYMRTYRKLVEAQPDAQVEDRKLQEGMRKFLALKSERKKGRVTLYTDGSGKVNEYELVERG